MTPLAEAGPLLTGAIMILAAMLCGAVARRVRLPAITGQIAAGVAMGPAVLELFTRAQVEDLEPLVGLALGIVGVTVGARCNVPRLRRAGRGLFLLLVAEAMLTPAIVFGLIVGLTSTPPGIGALFATCALATAPATIVAIVTEARATGLFARTLVAAVALNNAACICLFEVARGVAASSAEGGASLGGLLRRAAEPLLLAAAIGAGLGLVAVVVSRTFGRTREELAAAVVIAVVLAAGLAPFLAAPPLLACLILGLVQTNLTRGHDHLADLLFAGFLPAALAMLFTLASMHLSFAHAAAAGTLVALIFLGRIAGKLGAAELAMRAAHAPPRVRRNLGVALLPQAGLAAGLVVLVENDPAFADRLVEIGGGRLAPAPALFATVVLAVVLANRIVGPILTRLALVRTREAGMDRMRLIDFIQEENIVVDFRASSKTQAIERLVDLMSASHGLTPAERRLLLETSLKREAEASTCLGGGLFVPHGILPAGKPMVGVMAISREGIRFDTPDGRPVHCMVLLGTSAEERDRHLQVLAALARTIGTETSFRSELFAARSPAQASELLHGEESMDFNYFLEE
ncbi:MAG: PTS sugar transporter subunit IIA [Planctomycetota bacterium]